MVKVKHRNQPFPLCLHFLLTLEEALLAQILVALLETMAKWSNNTKFHITTHQNVTTININNNRWKLVLQTAVLCKLILIPYPLHLFQSTTVAPCLAWTLEEEWVTAAAVIAWTARRN